MYPQLRRNRPGKDCTNVNLPMTQYHGGGERGLHIYRWAIRCWFETDIQGEKFRLKFEMTPWTVVTRKGTLVTAQKGHESVTQNISFFKRYQSDIDTTANDLLLPPTNDDGGESETSRLGASDPDVYIPRKKVCVDNQGSPHRTTPEGCEGDELAETWEPGMVHECVVSNPPWGGSERYNLCPRTLPSSKLRTFWSPDVMGGAMPRNRWS
ncbi:hypothetical protein NDU88_001009 [Pleurodeles waltl]|uniref:Trimethylguanosine synthase n=1 Tax=Pleurodeles waltl TaxID=8319 RepID=A0AAV7UV02_PLEWA|nr:hypothetical protein NDU88_001009 [Pleurodeles waltl]